MSKGPPFRTRLLSTFATRAEQDIYIEAEWAHYTGRSYLRGHVMDCYCTNLIHKLKTHAFILDADKLEAACLALRARVDLELQRDVLEERETLFVEMRTLFNLIDS
jgi:hypothetical protein